MEAATQGFENQFIGCENMPRSRAYMDKTIESQGYVTIKGTQYFKRAFTDGSVELVRYDWNAKKWVVLCFIA